MAPSNRDTQPLRIFLTGEPGCGKTTVVKTTADLLSHRGLKVGGMTSNEIREHGVRTGFTVEDIVTHEQGTLADSSENIGPRVGKYKVNLMDLERIGGGAIKRALQEADVVIVDELGPMELHSLQFIQLVHEALASPRQLLATIHKRASHPLILEVKSSRVCEVIEVSASNRDRLPFQLAERFTRVK